MGDFANSITARMRRTFRYSDGLEDDDQAREELDEEEQDAVIKELRKQNEQWEPVYKVIFTALPFVSAAAFIPPLLDRGNTILQKLGCLLGVASLLATAYTMRQDHALRSRRHDKTPRRSYVERTTTDNYVLLSNTSASIFLALMGCYMKHNLNMEDGLWVLYLAPAAVLGVSMIVSRESFSVDIGELERLRYEYKGA